ncbi:MAG: ABC transporter ATP-binding protein [Deltaproteobacteria bacterium]|nr:ABC transporter ATP-binding protein [Deltaproteobacteria bacterium]
MERETVVRVSGLVKDFRPGLGLRKKRVLHGIDLEVKRGELFGFIGPNGAGKTTTLKILMGLIRATAGEASILGHDVRETAFREHIGFAPEAPYFYDFLTGAEILDFYAKLCAVPAQRRRERVREVLAQVGLAHAADARLRTYSKGMLQRIGIAQAIVHDPSVVFLDEPMSGLDPVGRKEIRDLVAQLSAGGKTIFMNTHILSDVESLCDRVAIIVQGRIAYQGVLDGALPSGEREVEATFSALSPELAEEAESRFEAKLSGRGERVTLRVAHKHVSELVQVALARGAILEELEPVRADLESLFLDAVAGKIPGGAK